MLIIFWLFCLIVKAKNSVTSHKIIMDKKLNNNSIVNV